MAYKRRTCINLTQHVSCYVAKLGVLLHCSIFSMHSIKSYSLGQCRYLLLWRLWWHLVLTSLWTITTTYSPFSVTRNQYIRLLGSCQPKVSLLPLLCITNTLWFTGDVSHRQAIPTSCLSQSRSSNDSSSSSPSLAVLIFTLLLWSHVIHNLIEVFCLHEVFPLQYLVVIFFVDLIHTQTVIEKKKRQPHFPVVKVCVVCSFEQN